MILGDREYKINVDGQHIETVTLTRKQYATQKSRDIVRREFAKKHDISTWGVRLVPVDAKYIFYTDVKTGKTYRKYVYSPPTAE